MSNPFDHNKNKEKQLRRLLNLLLVEDDKALRETLFSFFSAQGFNVHSAASGTEAIDIAMRQEISFSVMDINLPGLNGIEAFKFISREVGRMPCIFMSGDTSLDVMQQALNAGAFTFISKPIKIDLMRSSVERLLMKFFMEED